MNLDEIDELYEVKRGLEIAHNTLVEQHEAIQRVEALAERYLSENLVSPYPDMARQILAALQGPKP